MRRQPFARAHSIRALGHARADALSLVGVLAVLRRTRHQAMDRERLVLDFRKSREVRVDEIVRRAERVFLLKAQAARRLPIADRLRVEPQVSHDSLAVAGDNRASSISPGEFHQKRQVPPAASLPGDLAAGRTLVDRVTGKRAVMQAPPQQERLRHRLDHNVFESCDVPRPAAFARIVAPSGLTWHGLYRGRSTKAKLPILWCVGSTASIKSMLSTASIPPAPDPVFSCRPLISDNRRLSLTAVFRILWLRYI